MLTIDQAYIKKVRQPQTKTVPS